MLKGLLTEGGRCRRCERTTRRWRRRRRLPSVREQTVILPPPAASVTRRRKSALHQGRTKLPGSKSGGVAPNRISGGTC